MKSSSKAVIDLLFDFLGQKPQALHQPQFDDSESNSVLECISSSFVSTVGKYTEMFEHEICQYTGAKFSVATNSGTSALHLALLSCGVAPGDEVLVPSFTFIATVNAISYCGAIPHFVDISEKTLGVDPIKLQSYLERIADRRQGILVNKKTARRIRAIVVVHTFGHLSDMNEILELAKEFDLRVIEDAAESLGSCYEGIHSGLLGDVGVISFNGNKIVTTGSGGALITNNEEIGEKSAHMSRTSRVSHPWSISHDSIGYNYRMPSLNASLGLAQMAKLASFVASKRKLFFEYQKLFADLPFISIFQEPAHSYSNYWLQTMFVDSHDESLKNDILLRGNELGIGLRPVWTLIHTLRMYSSCPSDFLTTSLELSKKIINLPSSAGLVT